MIISRSSHTAAHGVISSFFVCFRVLAIVNSAAVNMGMHLSFQITFISGFMPRSRITGSNANSIISFLRSLYTVLLDSPVVLVVKNPPANVETQRHRFNPWVREIPWRRKWQPTPVFLPRESHGQRSLAGYSSWGHKESEMTEQLILSLSA